MNIEYHDQSESFGMSGPWLGSLIIDNKKSIQSFLDSNYVATEDKSIFAFNQYDPEIDTSKILFGIFKSTSKERRFRIVLYYADKEEWFISNQSWESLFLTKIDNIKVCFTNAFHDDDRKKFPEKSVNISLKNFSKVEESEIMNIITRQ